MTYMDKMLEVLGFFAARASLTAWDLEVLERNASSHLHSRHRLAVIMSIWSIPCVF